MDRLFFELFLLSLSLFAVVSIVWTSVHVGISPLPSSRKATQSMLNAITGAEEGVFIDLGSGWGTLVIALAQRYPHKKIIGYELSLIPWAVSVLRKNIFRMHNLSIYRKDFLKAELCDAAVFFCYLFPGAMTSFQEKLERKVSGKYIIISNTFALPLMHPIKTIRLQDIYKTPIYVYHHMR